MHGLRLPPHIHYGVSGGTRIFLDLREDRYFLLPRADEQLLEALEQQAYVEPSACRRLVDEGLLAFADEGRPIGPASHPAPGRSLVEESIGRSQLGPAHIGEILFDLLHARQLVRRRRLSRLLGLARKDEPAALPVPDLAVSVGAFLAGRRLVPLEPNCLRDSIALHRFLQRRGIACRIVIGAKLHPFAAHCWLQRDELVLNDTLSAAAGFTPVLVL